MQEQLPTTAGMQEVEQCRSNSRGAFDLEALMDIASKPLDPGLRRDDDAFENVRCNPRITLNATTDASNSCIHLPVLKLVRDSASRPTTMKTAITLLLTLSLAACSWGIKLDDAGKAIRVAWKDDVSACRPLGEITVSVLDNVGPVDRSRLKVSDELEVMARNEAATLRADTIKPVSEVRNGEQRWAAYACGPGAPPTSRNQAPRDDGEAQTFPIKQD
jgi:hypothetical protein